MMAEINTIEKRKRRNLQLKIVFIKYNKAITLFLVIIILVFSYYFILKPKYEQVGGSGSYNLSNGKEDYVKRKSYLLDLKKLVTNYRQISQQDLNKLKEILPDQEDTASLFVQFQALAIENNFLLAGVTINEVPEKEKSSKKLPSEIKKLNITLELVGDQKQGYLQLKEFLSSLERNLRLFDVNSIYFSPDSANYSINIFAYYYKPQ